MWYLDFSELVHMTFLLFIEVQQFPFEYRAIPCRRAWFSTNKLGESVDLKIKHWKRREGFFSPPSVKISGKAVNKGRFGSTLSDSGELRWMKSVSNLPEWGNVCKTVSKSQGARVTMLNKPRDSKPKPQLWKKGPGMASQLEPHFAWSLQFHPLPFPPCHFRAWRAPRLISSGPRALLTIAYRAPRWGSLVHWKQSDTDGVFGPRDKAESSSWEKRITLNLGEKKKSLQRWTGGKICSWKFPWISKSLFKPLFDH